MWTSVSQWQIEACVEGISEAFLLPVLEMVIAQFPFEIEGFHSDNGSEYINHKVAKLLEKLRIEQTKSRSRHSNDNALAESKNASVVRKHMGYSHIPQKYAKPINALYEGGFNSWLNLHRPCLYATEVVSEKGKIKRIYKHDDVKTPLECLVALVLRWVAALFQSAVIHTVCQVALVLYAGKATETGCNRSAAEASSGQPKVCCTCRPDIGILRNTRNTLLYGHQLLAWVVNSTSAYSFVITMNLGAARAGIYWARGRFNA